jgi:chlorophyll synthase
MTLNDFKAIEGDRAIGIRSLPVQLGADRAARVCCWVMAVPQVAVIVLLTVWGYPVAAAGITTSLLFQGMAMDKMLTDPEGLAPWYNGTGVLLYVLGMMLSAFALRGAVG